MKKLILTLLFFSSSVAFAADCDDSSGISDDIQKCAVESYQESDKKLNAVYQTIMAKLKKVASTRSKDPIDIQEAENAKQQIIELRNSQRDWIKYRDSECHRKTGAFLPMAGREQYLIYSYCPAGMTESRIKELTEKCQEGDMGCSDYSR